MDASYNAIPLPACPVRAARTVHSRSIGRTRADPKRLLLHEYRKTLEKRKLKECFENCESIRHMAIDDQNQHVAERQQVLSPACKWQWTAKRAFFVCR